MDRYSKIFTMCVGIDVKYCTIDAIIYEFNDNRRRNFISFAYVNKAIRAAEVTRYVTPSYVVVKLRSKLVRNPVLIISSPRLFESSFLRDTFCNFILRIAE